MFIWIVIEKKIIIINERKNESSNSKIIFELKMYKNF